MTLMCSMTKTREVVTALKLKAVFSYLPDGVSLQQRAEERYQIKSQANHDSAPVGLPRGRETILGGYVDFVFLGHGQTLHKVLEESREDAVALMGGKVWH